MDRCRGCEFPTGMVAPVSVCPAVVCYIAVAGGGLYNAALALQIRDRARKLVEGAVCRSKSRNRITITSRSGGKVGDGVHLFLLVKVFRAEILDVVDF